MFESIRRPFARHPPTQQKPSPFTPRPFADPSRRTSRVTISAHPASEPIQLMREENIESIKQQVADEGLAVSELYDVILAKLKEERLEEDEPEEITEDEIQEVIDQIKAACYTELFRIQDELIHNKPPGADEGEAGTGKAKYASWKDDDEEKAIVGYLAAQHTYGIKDASSFVSLAKDMDALADSTDIGEGKENVSNVVTKAKFLCTYLVPNAFAWTPQDMLDAIEGSEWANTRLQDKITAEEWLPGTPTKETEVLYYGNDLEKHMVGHKKNPYRGRKKKSKRK